MTSFNINATSLAVNFTCPETDIDVSLDIDNLPSPNHFAESINESENSSEEEFDYEENGHCYRVEIYVNIAEGNVAVYDITGDTELEIEDLDIEEFIEERDDE